MKSVLAVVDGNAPHRTMLTDALLSDYVVHSYDSPANAISGMHLAPPRMILVGQRVGATSGANFIRDLRKEKGLGDIPVVFIADSEDFRVLDMLRDLGIRDYLVKPYHRSALISMISKQFNSRVERSWRELPALQRKALEGTLNAFNSFAEEIANGNPLPYQEVNDSCAVLVEVVNREELGALLSKIRGHDNLTYVHSLRMSTLMSMFGKSIGLPVEQQILVASGGLLHDMGKMMIPRDLLNKQGPLSPTDRKILRSHVDVAQKILASTDVVPRGVSVIITQHHERLDGSGYPRGLAAAETNQLARMAGIIDVFCALTDRRPYKRTVAPHVALETMATEMTPQLDQELLFRFREILLDSGEDEEAQSAVA